MLQTAVYPNQVFTVIIRRGMCTVRRTISAAYLATESLQFHALHATYGHAKTVNHKQF
jgi:hypothetical protein